MSWPIRVTSRPVYAFSEGPAHDIGEKAALGKRGALGGEMIKLPPKTNVRVVEQLKMDERYGTRWLAKTTGKLPSLVEPGIMRQWWCYIGKDDLEPERKDHPIVEIEDVPVEPAALPA